MDLFHLPKRSEHDNDTWNLLHDEAIRKLPQFVTYKNWGSAFQNRPGADLLWLGVAISEFSCEGWRTIAYGRASREACLYTGIVVV